VAGLSVQAAVHKENASNTRAADGEWKLLPDKFMKVVKKVLNTWKEEDLESLREVCELWCSCTRVMRDVC
jgi:hypothetical protein